MVNYAMPDFNCESAALSAVLQQDALDPAGELAVVGAAHVLLNLEAHVGVWNRIFWVINDNENPATGANNLAPDYATMDIGMFTIQIPPKKSNGNSLNALAEGGVIDTENPSPFEGAEENVIYRQAANLFEGLNPAAIAPPEAPGYSASPSNLSTYRKLLVNLAKNNSISETYSAFVTSVRTAIDNVGTTVTTKVQTLINTNTSVLTRAQAAPASGTTQTTEELAAAQTAAAAMRLTLKDYNFATLTTSALAPGNKVSSYEGSVVEHLVNQSHFGKDGKTSAIEAFYQLGGRPAPATGLSAAQLQTFMPMGTFGEVDAGTGNNDLALFDACALQFKVGDTFELNYSVKHKNDQPANPTVLRIKIKLVLDTATISAADKALLHDTTDPLNIAVYPLLN